MEVPVNVKKTIDIKSFRTIMVEYFIPATEPVTSYKTFSYFIPDN